MHGTGPKGLSKRNMGLHTFITILELKITALSQMSIDTPKQAGAELCQAQTSLSWIPNSLWVGSLC